MTRDQPISGTMESQATYTPADGSGSYAAAGVDIRGLVGKSISDLRKLLLDLTLKNRLIKYNPDDGRTDHIRIVDEVPTQLIKKLQAGASLTFAPVPLPETEPEDEKTPEFQAALNKYKESDPDYLTERDKLGIRPKKKARFQLERNVRDALRKRLDMAPWKTTTSAKIHAQNLGIPTNYDLPREVIKAAHDDDLLQTLFFAEQMDAKLEAINTTTSTLEKDAGIQALYAGFGFLEWQPNKDSTETIQSPLLLWPLKIDRTLRNQIYEYAVSGQDDDEAVNESLFEKLKEDFGISLPRLDEYSDEESGEINLYEWFDAIDKTVKEIEPTWRVKNWVVIGIMTFHRISLWNDLNPERWPTTQNPLENETMTEIFGGTGMPWNEGTGGDYDIDANEASKNSCLLITDADSSQHSAIIDAMSGQNMVIEGPPGTGKSQTITNIIAAALNAGKTVLFVAEKIAALEVVKKRLDRHGLGHFCLELHSDKANRASVIKSVKSRKEMELPYHDVSTMESAKRSHIVLKERLSHYVKRMNDIAGDTGMTVHEIFWNHTANKQLLQNLPAELRNIKIPGSLSFGKFERHELLRLAKLLEGATTVFGDLRQPSKQPWRGIGTASLSSFDFDDIARELAEAATAIRIYEVAAEAVKTNLQWDASFDTPEDLDRHIHEAISSAPILPEPDIAGAIFGLKSPHIRDEINHIINALETIQNALEIVDSTKLPTLATHPPSELRSILAQAAAADVSGSTAELIEKNISHLEKQANTDASALAALEKLSGIVPVDRLNSPPALYAFLDAIRDEPPPADIREMLSPDIARESTISRLKQAKSLAGHVKLAEKTLGEDIDFTAIPSPASLRVAARHLREAGFLDRMKTPFREAKALGTRIDSTLAKAKPDDIAERLEQAIIWREAKAVFDEYLEQNPAIKAIVHSYRTSFDGLIAMADWIITVRKAIPIDLNGGDELFTAIVRATDAARDQINVLRDVHLETLRELAREHPDSIKAGIDQRQQRIARLQQLLSELKAIGWIDDREIHRLKEIADALDALGSSREEMRFRLKGIEAIAPIWRGENTPPALLRRLIARTEQIASWGIPSAAIDRIFASNDPAGEIQSIIDLLDTAKITGKNATAVIEKIVQRLILSTADWGNSEIAFQISFAHFRGRAEVASAHPDLLAAQCALLTAEQEALESPLGSIVLALQKADLSYDGLHSIIWPIWNRSAAEELIAQDPAIANHVGKAHETIRTQFQQLDNEILQLNRQMLANKLYRCKVPTGNRVGSRLSWTEGSLIDHQCNLERPSMHLRRLFSQAPIAIKAYKPCFMMSPMSVARYLAPGKHQFDLLVIDEASQMRPQDALGAILRAKQTIVVGDNKQLPPSNFFDRQNVTTLLDDGDPDVVEQSILELSMRAWHRRRKLNWHYRSRHQSLIQFSNATFYESQLIVFPSDRENGNDIGVELVEVFGEYAAGINDREARAVTERALQFMASHPDRSLGIVAVNAEQAERINELIMEATKTDPAAQSYQERWKSEIEDFCCKNLERVQGDERDTIFISTVYGKSPDGIFSQRYGPINSASGHRRLNVLFTRAKQQMVVFTSMDPDWIQFSTSTHQGVSVLQRFLRYAKTGTIASPITISPEAVPDNMFEEWFLDRLRRAGYDAVPQVGVKGYRIDIGIRHPDWPGRFILGLECDGATYHSAKSARDRDRLRQMVLENLGWRIHRIWSTDWFRNSEREFQTLIDRIEELRSLDREEANLPNDQDIDSTKFDSVNVSGIDRPNSMTDDAIE